MRIRDFRWGMPICAVSSLAWLTACQDPPAFVEHKFDQTSQSGVTGDSADASQGASSAVATPEAINQAEGLAAAKVITKKFAVAQSEKIALDYGWGGDSAEQTITMSYDTMSTTTSFKQPAAPLHTELFTQTVGDGKGNETFTQSAAVGGVLDMVVVVDNSGSMAGKQHNVSTKMAQLLDSIKDSQWAINVVTTDPRDGCMRALIQKGDQNVEEAFAQAINAGTAGSGSERGILQAVNALKCNGGSWMRQNSTVAVLIISDEDNCSNGLDCAGEPQATSSYLSDYLNSIRQIGVNARVYGIFWLPTQTAAQCSTGYNQAPIYAEAVTQTNGTMGSICDADYTPTLQAISKNIAGILKNQFAIMHIPVNDTLKVYVNDQLLANGYTVNGTVISLQNAPSAGSVIRIEYEYLTAATGKDFTLTSAASPVGLQVYGDGVLIDPSAYKYDQTAHAISFGDAPAAHEIKVVYYVNVVLPQDFAIKDEFVPGSLTISVNGVKLDPSAFTVSTDAQSVHTVTPPMPGALVEISYAKILKSRLRYPVLLAGTHMQITGIDNAITTDKVDYILDGNFVVFDEKDFENSRALVVHYTTDMAQTKLVTLNDNMLAGSPLTVRDVSGASCDVSKAIVGNQVNLSQCAFNAGDHIIISFMVMSEIKRQFTVEDEALTDPEKFAWTVMVNDKPITAFERDQNVITIDGLKMTDVVTVIAKANS